MNCQQEIIQLMGILEITEGKFDTVFDYDIKEPDKIIKYMNKYSVPGSDHLTLLNIYRNLYGYGSCDPHHGHFIICRFLYRIILIRICNSYFRISFQMYCYVQIQFERNLL